MKEGLFDSVDLNDLANSENGIIEGSKTPPVNTGKNNEQNNSDQDDDKQNKDAISFEEIANLDVIDEIKADEKLPAQNTKTPAENNANASSSSQDSALPSLALVLKEAGVFSSLNEEDLKDIKDVDGIIKAVEKQIKTNELADLSDEDKEYLEARRKGVSHAEFIQSKSATEQYKALEDKAIEENPNLQFELIRRSFLIKGYDEAKAKRYAEKMMEGDDAIEEALTSKKALIDHEEETLKNKIKEKQDTFNKKLKDEQDAIDSLKSKINENSEILPGVKVNSQTKDKIFNSMTTPVKNKDNKLFNEVMDLYGNDPEYKMKIHALHIITKGFTDFSKFKTTAKSAAVEDLEKIMREQGDSNHGSTKNFGASHSSGGSTTKSIIDALPDFTKKR